MNKLKLLQDTNIKLDTKQKRRIQFEHAFKQHSA